MKVQSNESYQAMEIAETQWGRAAEVSAGTMVVLSLPVPIPDGGYSLLTSWNPVRGATRVVLDDGGAGSASAPPAGSVRIAASSASESLGTIALTSDGPHRIYSNTGRRRIKSLTLKGLKMSGDGNPVYKKWDDFYTPASGKILRLVVATRASSAEQWMPVFAVPSIPARGVIPAMLLGATYSNEVLSFPYALPGQIRLTLFEHDAPEDFAAVTSSLTSAAATAEILPRDLELKGPTGQVVWSFPGEYLPGAPPAEPSLRVPIELALNEDLPAAIAERRPLRAEFKLTGTAAGEYAYITFTPARGALLREEKGLLHAELAGDPVVIPLGAPLDTEAPDSARGGFSVRYLGLRLLPELSDSLPSPSEVVRGTVVRDAAVLRELPPEGLLGISVAKIGLIGRAPEECELEVQLVRLRGGVASDPIGPPGRGVVTASSTIATAWVDLPVSQPASDPLAVSVRALRGRFFWAGEDRPRLRIVVRDPDPGGRPLLLGGSALLAVDTASVDVQEQIFPPSLFRSAVPAFASELFLSVDISDLTLRYQRP